MIPAKTWREMSTKEILTSMCIACRVLLDRRNSFSNSDVKHIITIAKFLLEILD